MKVKFLQQAIIENAAFHIGQEYDLHPTLAKSFINHGTAELVSGDDELDELAGVPFANELYARGIKSIAQIDLNKLQDMQGFNDAMHKAISDKINGVLVETLPIGTPYSKPLELAGFNTIEKVLSSANEITFLDHLQLLEVVEFLENVQGKEVIEVTTKDSAGKEFIEVKKTSKKK